jgi:NhaA family Na+:H+ antiporter
MRMNQGLARLPQEPVDRFSRPFARFLRIEALAAAVLLLCAIVAVVLANSRWSASYLAFWDTPVTFGFGDARFSRSIRHWIDDGAMSLFFFVVALELKREMVLGELRDLRMTAFSMAAALGGMVVPAMIFVTLERGGSGLRGWGVVMATDTAFVIGCLAVLGSRIPRNLRLFLLSVAIFDDVGAIMVIAIGYGSHLDWAAIACAAAALLAVSAMGRLGIRHIAVYCALGGAVWLFLDASGIHPTLAGVVLGLMTPADSWVSDTRLQAILAKVVAHPRGEHWSGNTKGRQDLRRAGVAAREALSPVVRLEIALHPWVAFTVLPVFALANAGVRFEASTVDWPLVAAVAIGLFCGKPIGIVLFSYLAAWLGLGRRPAGLSWALLAGGAMLTGIGFTMALLIADLALEPQHVASAKVGILCGSMLSALCGLAVLAWLTSRDQGCDAADPHAAHAR